MIKQIVMAATKHKKRNNIREYFRVTMGMFCYKNLGAQAKQWMIFFPGHWHMNGNDFVLENYKYKILKRYGWPTTVIIQHLNLIN